MTFEIIVGDVSEVLPTLEPESFDATLCDPPYGLSFMGKAWDHGVPAEPVWREVLRALRPGAHLIAFGGTRTFHRLTCAIEDADFAIRDCLAWMYGSGFPKSLDVSKAIDKAAGVEFTPRPAEGVGFMRPDGRGGYNPTLNRLDRSGETTEAAHRFNGYGTALKPAWEPAILAMKPTDGTFANNATEHGVAGVNVDGGRIDIADGDSSGFWNQAKAGNPSNGLLAYREGCEAQGYDRIRKRPEASGAIPSGRWPANVLLDPEAAAMLDEQSGELNGRVGMKQHDSGLGSASLGRFRRTDRSVGSGGEPDSGGASRFFYTAKASTRERNAGMPEGETCGHPTLKPVRLIEYLAKLLLPPPREDGKPRRILVPFSGAGSEVAGALRAGWDEVVGVELSEECAGWARKRVPALVEMQFKEPRRKAAAEEAALGDETPPLPFD